MNKLTLNNLRKTEVDLLYYLLERHIAEGNYFGRKDQHYKMAKELFNKLSTLSIEIYQEDKNLTQS